MYRKLLVLLSAVLLTTLTACGDNAETLKKVTGAWEYKEDFTEEVMDFMKLTDGDSIQVSADDLTFTVTGTLNITEDGLFTFEYSSDDVKKWVSKAKSEESELLNAYIEGLEEKIASGMDITMEDFGDKYEAVDYSQLYESIYGETFDAVLDRQFDAMETELIASVESMKDSGTVTAGKKDLRLSSEAKNGAYVAFYDEETDTVILNPETDKAITLNRVK